MERLTINEVIEHCNRQTERMENNFGRSQLEEKPMMGNLNIMKHYWEHRQVAEWLKELKEYRDLEEQGRLIKLPCKIGKNLYDIIEFVEGYESPDIFIIDASRIEISKDKEGLIYTIDGADYREKDFGTVLFTSEEEALKAISEKGWIL